MEARVAVERKTTSGFPIPFLESGKSIVLSSQGKLLQKRTESLFDQINAIKTEVAGDGLAIEGTYRLAASHFLGAKFLGRGWFSLQKVHPKLVGELHSMNTAQVLNEVASGAIDFGLCFSPQRSVELQEFDIHSGQLRIAVRKRHPLLKSSTAIALKELSKYPAAIHKAAQGVDICETHPIFEKFGIQPQVDVLFDDDDYALERVANSDAWTFVPDLVLKQHASQLEALPMPKGWNAPYTVAVVVSRHRADNRVLQKLKAELLRILS